MGLGRGVFRLAAMAAATIWLAGCMTARWGPEHPGTRVRYKSPDPQKWIGSQTFGDRRAIFRCRPLACPEMSIVSVRTSASPTRSPDPQALQKFAQESAAREVTKAERPRPKEGNRVRMSALLSTRVANVKNFPTIHWEYQGVVNRQQDHLYGPQDGVCRQQRHRCLLLRLSASRSLVAIAPDFVAVLEIEDFAPPPCRRQGHEIGRIGGSCRAGTSHAAPVQSSGSDGSARRRKRIC